MQLHANAKLGLAGRRALALAVTEGASVRAAARRFGVSPQTAKKWWQRWEQASEPQRRSLACLADRSSGQSRVRGACRRSSRSGSARSRGGLGGGHG